jgi:hypothetical protein
MEIAYRDHYKQSDIDRIEQISHLAACKDFLAAENAFENHPKGIRRTVAKLRACCSGINGDKD